MQPKKKDQDKNKVPSTEQPTIPKEKPTETDTDAPWEQPKETPTNPDTDIPWKTPEDPEGPPIVSQELKRTPPLGGQMMSNSSSCV